MTNMDYTYVLPILLAGLLIVTLIDTVGAIASRKLNFNYMWLGVASGILYTCVAYQIALQGGLLLAVIVNNLIGFYDATVGLKLALALKANYIVKEEEKKYLTTQYTVASMMLVASVLALLGYIIAK